jgi:hypothetical protein
MIKAYRQITVTPEFQEAERLREKASHDEAQALYNADHEALIRVAKNLLALGMPIEKIIKGTGLTHDEVEGLRLGK